MKKKLDAAPFIVEFANTDLAQLSTKAWSLLKDDLRRLLRWSPNLAEHEAELMPARITAVQKFIAGQLHRFAAANTRRGHRPPDGLLWAEPVHTVTAMYFDLTTPGDLRFSVDADLRDAMLLALGLALSGSDVTRLRQCPPCGTVFWAQHGRQLFCSAQCKDREAGRHYREEHRAEERLRAQRHYREKITQQRAVKNPAMRKERGG